MQKILTGILLIGISTVVYANTDKPYQGQQTRAIKSLSQTDIDGYLDGKGMGLVKAAELNHYPGPRHVLDVADKLGLTDRQKAQTRQLFDQMKARAMAVGKQLLEKEQQFDDLFSSGKVRSDSLEILLQQIGALQAKLRYIHLNTHLDQKKLLSPGQVAMYDRLRGYTDGMHGRHEHTH